MTADATGVRGVTPEERDRDYTAFFDGFPGKARECVACDLDDLYPKRHFGEDEVDTITELFKNEMSEDIGRRGVWHDDDNQTGEARPRQ